MAVEVLELEAEIEEEMTVEVEVAEDVATDQMDHRDAGLTVSQKEEMKMAVVLTRDVAALETAGQASQDAETRTVAEDLEMRDRAVDLTLEEITLKDLKVDLKKEVAVSLKKEKVEVRALLGNASLKNQLQVIHHLIDLKVHHQDKLEKGGELVDFRVESLLQRRSLQVRSERPQLEKNLVV